MLAEDEPKSQERLLNRWVWSDCKLVLRRKNPLNGSEESYENLEAEVELQSQDIEEPFMPEFNFRKELQFNPMKGFYCRQEIPLPALKVKLQKSYLDLLHEDQQIILIYCDITVAYPRRKDTHFYLQQIQTQGEKRKLFSQQGQVTFDNIIIKQSSIKKMNSKFSILVSICASSIEENRIILKTLISTAFFTEPCKIIRRNRFIRQPFKMKLLSPMRFLKPISTLPSNRLKQVSVKQIVETIKEINKNSNRLFKLHPFYLIYHFVDIFEFYYDSEQVEEFNQIFSKFCPFFEGNRYFDAKIHSNSQQKLQKTKKIKKESQNFNRMKKTQLQQNLYIQLNNHHNLEQKNLILITFHRSILQCVLNEIQRQKSLSKKSMFQHQVNQLSKMLQNWRLFQFRVDLLRKNRIESFWKDIQRDYVFETYKRHYKVLQEKLLRTSTNNFIETQKLTDDMS